MESREIVLIPSSIRNGRIYFSTADAMFFPPDSYGNREAKGHKGTPVKFFGMGIEVETHIRIISGQRLSPQRSFAVFLKGVGAAAGSFLRVTRISHREYKLEYLG